MTTAEMVGLLVRAQEALSEACDLSYEAWVDIDQSLAEAIARLGKEQHTPEDSEYIRGLRVGRKEGNDGMKSAAVAMAEAHCCWWCRKETVAAIQSLRAIGERKKT